MMSILSVQAISVSSLYGNARADLKAGNEFIREAMGKVRGCIPYLGPGTTVEEERDRFAKRYERMMEIFGRMSGEGDIAPSAGGPVSESTSTPT